MFTAGSGVSSKRINGTIGWLTCVGIAIYCTILVIQAPIFVEALLWGSAALLGVDTVTKIWRKPKNEGE